ncbi:ROK family protein [Sphingomonas sp. CJ99]
MAIGSDPIFAAIEAGGTKFVCAAGTAEQVDAIVTIETTDPERTLEQASRFIEREAQRAGRIDAIGIGSFGPIDLIGGSPTFGRIGNTPKPGWQGVDIRGWFASRHGCAVAIDTDVNAAAMAEARAIGSNHLAYVTIGTGIGAGIVRDGRTILGFGHLELGHLPARRHARHATFRGICPYHGDCFEGLASGPAIRQAWGHGLDALPDDHPAWAVEAFYIGQLCAAIALAHAPDHIVLGGGVMNQAQLLPLIHRAMAYALGSYLVQWTDEEIARRVTLPAVTDAPPGLVGAMHLARAIASESVP